MKKWILVPAIAGMCVWANPGHADMQWTEVIKMGGGQGMSISTTKWAKKDAERSETSMKMGPMEIKNVEITRCDKGQVYKILPGEKTYTVEPLAAGGGMMPALPMGGMPGMGMPGMGVPGAGASPGGGAQKGKGTVTIESTLRQLGNEKVAGIDCRHYEVTMKITTTGCAGSGSTTQKMETWMADIPYPVPCLAPTPESAAKAAAQVKPACDVTTQLVGDTDAMAKAFSGFQMRMKMETGKGSFVKEVTMLSRAEQPDEPFAIPADWKQVSAGEFARTQQRAMMKAMMGGQGMPNMPGMEE